MSFRFLSVLILISLLSGCLLKDDSPVESSSDDVNLIQSGDIVIVNNNSDAILLLNSDGTYKEALVDSPTDATLLFGGVTYDRTNNQLLYLHDSTTNANDAVRAISLYDGEVSTYLTNSNLAGVLPGLARLTGGELVVLETTTVVEKFLADRTRITPFTPTLTATVLDIRDLNDGGFMVCNNATTNSVRTFSVAGVTVATATSASPAPSLGALAPSGCDQGPNGNIAVVYSGATDSVRMYNSALSTISWTFSDNNVLTTPGRLSVGPNGHTYVIDTGFNHIVEIDENGSLVQTIGGTVLSGPAQILVVP